MLKFTTRRYPYRRDESQKQLGDDLSHFETLSASTEFDTNGKTHRLVLGIDSEPAGRQMTQEEIDQLQDPFAQIVLSMDRPSLSLRSLLAQFDLYNDTDIGLPEQNVFMIAEGGLIDWNDDTSDLDRGLRVVVTRSTQNDTRIMISTTYPFEEEGDGAFLQVIGWDDSFGVFNYYERRVGRWFWAGNSWHALNEPTRGRGPFDSHINGSVVMKELRDPWIHWHSQAQSIPFESFGPDNPLRYDTLLQNRSNAENLELSVIVPLIERWTNRRLDKQLSKGNKITGVIHLMRQILSSTSFNLVSSQQPSSLINNDSLVPIPTELFIDKEGLFDTLDILPDIGVIKFSGENYKEIMHKYNVSLKDKSQQFQKQGDAFFPFITPCRAFEDTVILREMISRELISEQFAAVMLMIDFPNPIGSIKRASLMKYVPDVVDMNLNNPYPIQQAILKSIDASLNLLPASDIAFQVIEDMKLTDWREVFSLRITDYLRNVQLKAGTLSGLDDYFQLIESRRRLFKKKPLSEFDLTLPSSSISTSVKRFTMHENGNISEITSQ